MKTFSKSVGIVLLIFIVVASLLSYGSLWSLRKSSFYKPAFLVNAVAEDEFDYIILGASTGLTTLNTKVIDSILKTKGINLSVDDTALPSQYLMLQHFLAEGKTTKYCIVAPTINNFDVKYNKLSGNDYRFLMFNNKSYVNDFYASFESTEARLLANSQWMPFLGVSYYNAELFYPSLQSMISPKKRNRFDDKGNYVYPILAINKEVIDQFTEIEIQFQNPYVKKINALCKANGIQLICYLSPVIGKKAVCASEEFFIINHSDLLKNKMFFYDKLHVNARGRQLASEQFAQTFNSYLNLADEE